MSVVEQQGQEGVGRDQDMHALRQVVLAPMLWTHRRGSDRLLLDAEEGDYSPYIADVFSFRLKVACMVRLL